MKYVLLTFPRFLLLSIFLAVGLLSSYSLHAQKTPEKIESALAQNNFPLALQLIDSELILQPDNASLVYLKGNTLEMSGQTEEALRYFEKLAQDSKSTPMPFLAIANIYLKLGATDQWREALNATIQAHPNDARAYHALGNDYLELAKQYLVAANQATENPILSKQVALVVAAQSAELVMTTPSYQAPDETTKMQVSKETEYSEEQIRQQIVSTLRAWSSAWSSQIPAEYFKYYSTDFRPHDGMTVEHWAAVKTKRLTETEFIDIQLTDVKIAVADAHNVVVRFTQKYASSTYQGSSNKEMRLVRSQGGWIIVNESEL